ncbi:MAG: ParB/RepB/Spo0J family partition protein [candidate division NC10 bacterium]|nr:ParB/RepB/Spo0J family partition protein [candidate division NC10 bacterium]
MQRKALGKGLGALIPLGEEGPKAGLFEIPLEEIRPNPYQPRKSFPAQEMKELAASIRARGVLSPVILRRWVDGYELVAGERRWRAAKEAGLKTIPALVQDVSSDEILEIALIENLQREDLNPLEEAEAYQRLIQDHGLTQEEISRRVGKDRASIANILRLLHLPPPLKEDLANGRLTMGHARALLSLEGEARQLRARNLVVARGLSVRQTEELVQSEKKGRAKKGKGSTFNPHWKAIEEDLGRRLGTRVKVFKGRGPGRVEIEFYSEKDLDRIWRLICGKD